MQDHRLRKERGVCRLSTLPPRGRWGIVLPPLRGEQPKVRKMWDPIKLNVQIPPMPCHKMQYEASALSFKVNQDLTPSLHFQYSFLLCKSSLISPKWLLIFSPLDLNPLIKLSARVQKEMVLWQAQYLFSFCFVFYYWLTLCLLGIYQRK